jgi:type I restriction enzyme S subunit
MTAERLLAHFETISEAPDAIARLRSFILDLAVRGKLVEQDPEDEPVPLLLDEIKSRKRRLRLNHAFLVIDRPEIPFDEPSGWTWCRLGEVCEKTGSGSTPRGGKDVYKNSGIPFLRSQNIYNDGLRLDDVAFIDVHTHERMEGTRVLPCDLLLNITGGSIGRCAKVPLDFGEANISQHVAIIRVAARGMEEFLHSLILSPYFQEFVNKSQTGAGRGGLPKNRMDAIPIPLPPLAEQQRIVAKVDELMALCDQLEAARQQREQGREWLMAATLQRLNQPAEETASFRNDARFALQVLPSLTTTPAQIKQLRQTILNLAVRGKLVEQDPEDEPAEELLAWITAEKALMVADGVIRKERPLPPPDLIQAPFQSPPGWIWAHLGLVTLAVQGFAFSSGLFSKTGDEGLPLVRIGDIGSDFPEVFTTEFPGDAFLVKKGDILLGLSGSIKSSIWRGPRALLNQRIARIRPVIEEMPVEWLQLAVGSCISKWKDETSKFTVQNIKSSQLSGALIVLPPLAEQHRIVAKVDELMALCDQLEQQLSQADQQRRRLLEALLAESLREPEKAVATMA